MFQIYNQLIKKKKRGILWHTTAFICCLYFATFSQASNSVTAFVQQMSDEEKIAQMMMVRAYGTGSEEISDLLNQAPIGNFFMYTKIEPESTIKNIEKLQSLSLAKTKLPALIGIDQEGGTVSKLKLDVQSYLPTSSKIPYIDIAGATSIGATKNPSFAHQMGRQLGKILYLLGYNLFFSPVVDVTHYKKNHYMNSRSFGPDPHLVKKMARAFVKGIHQSKIFGVFKHFPGYGDATANSHKKVVHISKTKQELLQTDLIPYQLEGGMGDPTGILSNIAVYSHLDPSSTVTLSRKVISHLLKKELGFKGLVISDDLGMKGYLGSNLSQRAIRAIQAGHDMVLLIAVLKNQNIIKVFNDLVQALKEGKISQTQVNASVEKIIRLKKKLKKDSRNLQKKQVILSSEMEKLYRINRKIFVSLIRQVLKTKERKMQSFLHQKKVVIFSDRKFYDNLRHLEVFKNQKLIYENSFKKSQNLLKENSYVGLCYDIKNCHSIEPSLKKKVILISKNAIDQKNSRHYPFVFPTYGPAIHSGALFFELV